MTKELTLPVLPVTASVNEVMLLLLKKSVSGLLIENGPLLFLVHANDLKKAIFAAQKQRRRADWEDLLRTPIKKRLIKGGLVEIAPRPGPGRFSSDEGGGYEPMPEAVRVTDYLKTSGDKALVYDIAGGVGTIIARSTQFMRRYSVSPKMCYCLNPDPEKVTFYDHGKVESSDDCTECNYKIVCV